MLSSIRGDERANLTKGKWKTAIDIANVGKM